MTAADKAYEDAIEIMRRINFSIGAGAVLTAEEKNQLLINGRIQQYLRNRLERGEEIFESEKREAGKSTGRPLATN
jgi:hypothetical protein